jgi:hypothetical protein
MVSAAVARLPSAVSLLLLAALFMQFSEVSLALPWPPRVCLPRVLLCVSCCYKLSPFQDHWGRWHCTSFLPTYLFTVHVGSGSSPLSCGVFLPPTLSQAFPLLVAGQAPLVPLDPLWPPSLFIGKASPPPSSVLRVPHPLCNVSLLLLLLITEFLFFHRVEVGLSRGLCCSGLGCLWEYHGTAKLTWSASLQAVWVRATGSPGALLVSPFKWSGDSLRLLEVWKGQSFASSLWFCLQGVSPESLQDFTIGGTLSASSL